MQAVRSVRVSCFAEHAQPAFVAAAGVTVCVDVFRATTTAVTAVTAGRRCIPVGLAGGRAPRRRRPRPAAARRRAGRQHAVRLRPPEQPRRGRRPAGRVAAGHPALDVRDAAPYAGRGGRPGLRRLPAQLVGDGRACGRAPAATSTSSAPGHGASSARRTSSAAPGSRRGSIGAGFAPADAATAGLVERWRDADVAEITRGKSAAYLRDTGQSHDIDFVLAHVDDVAARVRDGGGRARRRPPTRAAARTPATGPSAN